MLNLIEYTALDSQDFENSWQQLHELAPEFLELPRAKPHIAEAQRFVANVKQKNLVVVGFGGSSLGTIGVLNYLMHPQKSIKIINNNDPNILHKEWKEISENLEETHFLFVSKSGNTTEVLTILNFILGQSKGIKLNQHFSVVTEDKDSLLFDWAKSNSCQIYFHPKGVGGRYSVLSTVGLLPFQFCGLDCQKLLDGAESVKNNKDLVFKVATAVYSSCREKYSNHILWFYNENAFDLGQWLVQLWSESLGKLDSKAAFPVQSMGARDQHSVLQQYIDGPRDKCFMLFQNLVDSEVSLKIENRANADFLEALNLDEIYSRQMIATAMNLKNREIPTTVLEMGEISEYSAGQFIMLFEIVISLVGLQLGINPYDQPGVEETKVLQKELLIKGVPTKI